MTNHIVLIVDKSGSMAKLTNDTIGGFNSYLDNIEGNPKVAAMLFDTSFKVLFKDKTPKKATRLNSKNYCAGGMTALYDAVGKSLEELEFPHEDRVLFVVMTDGEENSSLEYSANRLKAIIKNREELGWDFMYIGSGVDSWKAGGAMGVPYYNTVSTDTSTGYGENLKWQGLVNATNIFQYAAARGEDNPIIVAYTSTTAPVTSDFHSVKVWSK